jgi:hypothetical protein
LSKSTFALQRLAIARAASVQGFAEPLKTWPLQRDAKPSVASVQGIAVHQNHYE